MKRHVIHLAFAAATLATAAVAGWQFARLAQAERVNDAIARAGAGVDPADAGLPEAALGQALVLAHAGDIEGATRTYKALIAEEGRSGAQVRQAARYNLGNLHLRQALAGNGDAGINDRLPLVELAKQRYRDALRAEPGDWDARYNLERALWLAPEIEAVATEDERDKAPRERVVTTLQGVHLDLP